MATIFDFMPMKEGNLASMQPELYKYLKDTNPNKYKHSEGWTKDENGNVVADPNAQTFIPDDYAQFQGPLSPAAQQNPALAATYRLTGDDRHNVLEGREKVDGKTNTQFFSGDNLMGYAGAIAHPLLSLLGNKFGNIGGKGQFERFREVEVDQALQQNLADRQNLQQQSPEANRLAKANNLQMGKANAVNSAAMSGASAAANAGLGGDMNSALIQGIQQAAPVMQASQGYDQALADTHSQKAQEQAQLNQQLAQSTMDRGVLADMTAYHARDGLSRGMQWGNLIPMLLGGQDMGMQVNQMIRGSYKGSADVKDKNNS
jgi:hypothetical protein